MAPNDADNDAEEEDDVEEEKTKLKAKEDRQLDSITDHFDSNDEANVDKKELEKRMADLMKHRDEKDRVSALREKELASVKVRKEDLDVMVTMFPLMEKEQLDRVLREHQ